MATFHICFSFVRRWVTAQTFQTHGEAKRSVMNSYELEQGGDISGKNITIYSCELQDASSACSSLKITFQVETLCDYQ